MADLLQKAAGTGASPHHKLLLTDRDHAWIRPAVLSSQDFRALASSADRTAYEHVQALFVEARYSWDDPLSARSFSEWRNTLPNKQDRVTEIRDGNGTRQFFRLRTRTAASVLRTASLTLRADTLHPVSGSFEFRGDVSVDLSEQAEPVVEPSAISQRMQSAPVPAPAVTTTETAAGPEDELHVLAALDSISADAGESITVNLDAFRRHIVVSGMGIVPEYQREVTEALSKIPNAVVRFDAIQPHPIGQEAKQRAQTVTAPAASPLHQLLEDRAEGPRQFQQIVDESLEASSVALSHAHVLWMLSQKFPPGVEASFKETDRETLRALEQEHARALEGAAQRLDESLKPLLNPAASRAASPEIAPRRATEPGSWQTGAKDLLDATRACDQLLNQVLAGTEKQTSPAAVLGKLSDRLNRLLKLAGDQIIAAR